MSLYFGENMGIRRGYIPDNICGIGPPPYKKENGFNITSGSSNKELVKDKNIEDKVREQRMNKGLDIHLLDLIERNIENYRW